MLWLWLIYIDKRDPGILQHSVKSWFNYCQIIISDIFILIEAKW